MQPIHKNCIFIYARKKTVFREIIQQFSTQRTCSDLLFLPKTKAGAGSGLLYKETRDYYSSESQPSINPVVFFKLILVGHLKM